MRLPCRTLAWLGLGILSLSCQGEPAPPRGGAGGTEEIDPPLSAVDAGVDAGSVAAFDAGTDIDVGWDASPQVPMSKQEMLAYVGADPATCALPDPAAYVAFTPIVPVDPTQAKAMMTGIWFGHATAPENWWPAEWSIALNLGADGTYTAIGDLGSAFYYGSDLPCALKKWREGSALVGQYEIDVTFDYSPYPCGLPTWQGILTDVQSDGANRLAFRFSTGDGYGPVIYDLVRACPAP